MADKALALSVGAIIAEGQFWPLVLIIAVAIYVVYDAYVKRGGRKR